MKKGPTRGRRGRPARAGATSRSRGDGRPRAGAAQAEEGRVVAIESTTSQGQRVVVEADDGERLRVACLGEPVEEGARVRFERIARGARTAGDEGVLVRVLDAERSRWVCTLRRFGDALVPIPFGGAELPRLVLARGVERRRGARTHGEEAEARESREPREGDRVVVVPLAERESAMHRRPRDRARASKRTRTPARREPVEVRIVEVLGTAGDLAADAAAIAWKYRLPAEFTRRARLEADARADVLSAHERAARLDLRHLPFVTIDPASARDHDDALCAEAMPEGSGADERLWVAIADVSHFVAEGGFLDAEARRRGNSFYFPDRALPMLPERLSSDLCSLVPEVDRLAMVVELWLAGEGRVVEARFHEAVIRSHAKLAYEAAAAWLADATGSARPGDPVWGASLRRLARISDGLGRARRRAGAIELELPEVEIEVDAGGRPVDARMRPRNRAHALVEEAMLAANRAVAAALERAGEATIHRVHPPPDPRRLEALTRVLERFGVEGVEAGAPLDEPGAIAVMLARVAGTPAAERIHRATLRAMSQARYEIGSRGHFALQFAHYLHFTSPIRRYADLCVHRSLKRMLRARRSGPDAPTGASEDDARRLALWLSGRERVAVDAEREAIAFASCALLAGREGESFAAELTGVTEFGFFVRVERPVVEGLVPLRTLDRAWQIDAEREVARRGGGSALLEVGSRVRVRLLEIDGDRGRLAFSLIEERSRGSLIDERPRERRRGRRGQGSASASERASQSR